jgi:hypothetical protein
MQALALIRGLRRLLEREIQRTPICTELKNVERVLGLYENIVIQNGLQNKQLGDDVLEKFLTFIEIAQQSFSDGRISDAPRRATLTELAPGWAARPDNAPRRADNAEYAPRWTPPLPRRITPDSSAMYGRN